MAEANAYFLTHVNPIPYDDYPDQDIVLMDASRSLDFYMDWYGEAVANETIQAMGWPRVDVFDTPSDIIPQRVKNATFELANYIADNNGVIVELAEVNKIKVGPIAIDLDSEGSGYLLPPQISRILSNLGVPKSLPKNGVSVVALSR